MEGVLTTKAEEKKPSRKAAPDSFSESAPRSGERGVSEGMPLFLRHKVQTKLVVGAPDDPLEREADQIAEHVVQGRTSSFTNGHSTGKLQRKCECDGSHSHGKCPACQEEEEKRVHAKAQGGAGPQTISVPAALNTSAGTPLTGSVRERVEPVLGADLGHVRVHSETSDQQTAQALQAKAFTYQNHIWLGPNQSAEDLGLMAHEAAHVVQQSACTSSPVIQRDPVPDAPPPKSSQDPKQGTGEKVEFAGLTLTDDPGQLREAMLKLVAVGMPDRLVPAGIGAPDAYLNKIHMSMAPMVCGDPGSPDYDFCHGREVIRTKILPVLLSVVDSLRKEHEGFLNFFADQIRSNARVTLDANKEQANREALHYGIATKYIEHFESLPGGVADSPDAGGNVTIETVHEMDKNSPAGKGLRDAAAVLLDRRRIIEEKKADQFTHTHFERDRYDPQGKVLVPDAQFYAVGREIEEKQRAYNELRDYLSSKYPILAAFSDLQKDTAALAQLTQGPGPETAGVIAAQIADTLSKIQTSREGLDEPGRVNVWRLPKMVGLTRAQLAVDGDAVKKSLVEERIKHEQPGILDGIAILVLNIAALLLAGPTGGLSLVAAAGVNAYAAYQHVQDYIVQDAMAGSAFHQAQAISQDDPSLFWLAVEIIGVGVDAATAVATVAKAFRALAPFVRAAKTAEEGAELEKALQKIEQAAKEAQVGDKAPGIINRVKQLRKGDDAALKALGVSEEEAKTLQAAAKAADVEATADAIGTAATTSKGTKVTLTKNGQLFVCSSPCTILREKYLDLIAKDEKLQQEVAALEQRAARASEEAAKGTSEGSKLAEQVKQDAVALESKLRKVQVETAVKGLSAKYKVLQDLGLDAVAVERVLAKKTLDHMKGQLLEELMAGKIHQMLAEEGGKTALLGEKVAGKLDMSKVEFIEGHRISLGGKQFSDGMIVVRDGDKVHVLTVVESKAGSASGRGLRVSRESLADLVASDEAYKEAREYAIDLLREKRPQLENVRSSVIEAKYGPEVDAIFKDVPRTEAGQMRKDIERLVPNSGQKSTPITIDGQTVKAIGSPKNTKIVNFVPSDVATGAIEKAAEAQKLNAATIKLGIDQKQLESMASDIAKSLAAAE